MLSFQDYFLQLVSGLIGAIVGVLGTLYATRSQIRAILRQEQESKQQQISVMKYYFKVEIEENLALLENKERNMAASLEAWTLYKGNISSLSASLQKELIALYTTMKTYNSIAEQISSMYLQDKDNNPLFPLLEEQKGKILARGHDLIMILS